MKTTRLIPAAFALALPLAGCGPSQPAKTAAPPPQVTVVTVKRTSVPVDVELPGRTSAYLVAQVRARVDGIVQKRTYVEGADVKANQQLYQIDPAQYRAALDSALANQQKMEANLVTANLLAERYQLLVGGNAVSKQAYDNAVAAQKQAAADVAAAKAAVALARLNLGYTTVVSPISGRSSASLVTQGAYVQASAATLLTTVQQIDPMYVDLNQASVAGLQLRRDAASGALTLNGINQVKVRLILEDGSEYPLTGSLQFTSPSVDPTTGSVTIRGLFPNPQHVLLPGMFVRARFAQGVNDRALLVPVPAVTHDSKGQATALVVGRDNKVVQRTVQAQNVTTGAWVVTAGLNDGDRVIVSGVQKVQPGTLVKATEAPNQAVPAAPPAQVPAPTPGAVASNQR